MAEDKNEKKSKKTPLINPLKKIDDFECTEELNFKKTSIVETKTKFQEKTIEKSALIDRKNHRL